MDGEKIIEEDGYKILGVRKSPKVFRYLNNSYAFTIFYCPFAAVTCKFLRRVCKSVPARSFDSVVMRSFMERQG